MNEMNGNKRTGGTSGELVSVRAAFARNSSVSASRFRLRPFSLAVASAFALPLLAPQVLAQALPSGGTVVNGAATITQNGKTLTVVNTPGAVINWQSFSIGAGATAQFIQQNSASAVFNRVTGNDPSMILGNLSSNGQVFLINPNGITIGAGARIDAAAFVASTLGISNNDLLAGKFKFEGGVGTGNVVNQGTIVTQSGGFVYFIGKDVTNSGVIHTPQGQILLAAGKTVEIINPKSPDVRVEISADANEAVNLGKLVAAGGTIGMYAGNVRQKGVISATTAEVNAQGRIVLVAKKDVEVAAGSRTEANGPKGGSITIQAQGGVGTVEGIVEAKGISNPVLEAGMPVYNANGIAATNTITVTASPAGNGQQAGSAQPVFVTATPVAAPAPATPGNSPTVETAAELTGGVIHILGQGVNLTGNASIDASGEKGGGTILIGGDYQGGNAAVQNSLRTYVGSNVYLRADGLIEGNGGKVVVWADEATHFTGSLSAMGGLNGGNGGLGEISGKLYLYFRPNQLSLAARKTGYQGGTLLLDPSDVTIKKLGAAGDQSTGGAFVGGLFTPVGATSEVDIDQIETLLNAGTNVTITSSSVAAGLGDITLATGESITKTAGATATLTLQAHRNIVLSSGSNISSTSNALNVSLQAGTGTTGSITMNGGITTNGGDVNMTASGGAINMNGNINTGAGNLNMTATAGSITQLAGGVLFVGGTMTARASAAIALAQNNNTFSTINLSGGSASVTNLSALTIGTVTLTGALGVVAEGTITLNGVVSTGSMTLVANAGGAINQAGGSVTVSTGPTSVSGAGISLNSATNNIAGAINLTGGANTVTLNNNRATQLGTVTASALNVSAAGAISQTAAAVTVSGVTTLTAGAANDITLGTTTNNFGTVAVTSGKAVTLVDGTGNLTLGNVTASGGLQVTALAGSILQSGTGINVTGTTTLAASGAITLDAVGNNFSTVNSSGTNVTLVNSGAIILGTTTADNLNVTSLAGGISQSGDINVSAGLTTLLASGAGNNINLNRAGNDFLTVVANGAAVTLVDSNAIVLGSTTAGILNVSAAGAITQSSNITTTTSAAFTGTGITLDSATNSLAGPIALTGGTSAVTLNNNRATELGTVTSGVLNVSAAGALTQSGPITAATSASFTGNGINLNSATNNLAGTITLAGGAAAVTLNNNRATELGVVTAGVLNVSANGNLTQVGGITAGGNATFAANTGNITIDNAGNSFSGNISLSGATLTLNHAAAVTLGNVVGSGALNVSANGISQAGGTSIAAVGANLNSNGAALTIDSLTNSVSGTINLTGGTAAVTLNNNRATALGTVTAGALNVSANGAITQSGNITTTTSAAFTGTGINLNSTTNSLAGPIALTGGTSAVTLNNNRATELGTVTSGVLNVSAAGAITQSGPITAATSASFTGNGINLNSATNNLAGPITLTGGTSAVTLNNNAATQLGTVSAGVLNVSAAGAITQSGPITAATSASFTGNGINLNSATNNLAGTITLTGGTSTVTLNNNRATELGTVTAGALNVSAAGAITQSSNITTTTSAAFAGTGITLDSATNSLAGPIALTGGTSAVTLNNNRATELGTVTSGVLNVSAAGAITQSGPITAATSASFTGNGINLNSATNNLAGTITLAGGAAAVTLNNNRATELGVVTAGVLNVSANGAITQFGATTITATGNATFATNASNITIGNAGNTVGGNISLTGAAVSVRDDTPLSFGGVNVSSLTAVSNGAITQGAGTITVSGATSLTAGIGNDITLNSANNFGSVAVVSGRNVSLNDTDGIVLGTSSVAIDLNVTAGGAITQSGALTVGNNGTFSAAGQNITLNNTGNGFGGKIALTGAVVSITDSNGNLNLGNVIATGGLSAVATGGNIIQGLGDTIVAGGTTSLNAGASNDISLGNANDFATVSVVSGRNVTLSDINGVALGASTVSGFLDITASGNITQSGALAVTGATTLAAGAANDITLNGLNNFSTLSITSGRNVSVNDTNALILGASTVSGTLGVTTGGAITQTGALSVGGAATFAAGSGNDITLDNINNNFSSVGITSGKNVALVDANALVLAASTVSGTLDVTTAGNITQSGPVSVAGLATFAAGNANDITLGDSGNNFSTVKIVSGNNVTISDANTIFIGPASTAGDLTINAVGAIAQAGALTVGGTATFGAGSANNITLDNVANDFNIVRITSGKDVVIKDVNSVILGTSTISGTLNVATSGSITQSGALVVTGSTTLAAGAANDITLSNGSNNFSTVLVTSGNNVTLTDANALDLGASIVSGALTVNTTGAITQSGALSVVGTTTLAAGAANNITLNNGANNFSSVAVTSGNNVQLTDANSIDLMASTISGTLGVNTSGDITQNGALVVAGVTTLAAGSTHDITLTNATNNFSTIAITNGRNVSIADVNALVLGASTVSGTLDVLTAGAITQSGALIVTGATTLAAGAANNITLNGANNFSTLSITSGNNVGINDINALVLGASTISGTLGVTTSGAITQSGSLSVTGATTLAAGAANNITLTDSGNNFSSVGITSGNNVSLRDSNALDLAASTVSGTLGVTTNGAITQSGALVVTGATTLAAGAANNITLSGANNFSTLSITSGNNVSVTDINALALGASTVSGTLGVTTSGAITQSGALNVAGATTLSAGAANNITLTDSGNNFSSVGITSGNNVSLRDSNALDLAASTVSGTLGVTTNGAITQSGALAVTGITTLAAGAANDITLSNGANNFSTVVISNGNNVALADSNALILGASTVSGTLGVTTSGAITQSGALVVIGGTTLAAGAANDITLDNASNNFSSVGITSGNNVSLRDANSLVLAASSVAGTLGVTTNGAITQSGALTVAGVATFGAGAGNDITLTNGANNFGTVVVTSGGNVGLTDVNMIRLAGITASGTVTVGATNTVLAGNINTTGGTVDMSGAGPVTLTTNVQINTGNGAAAGGDVTFGNFAINGETAGTRSLSINTQGAATGGSITLGNVGNTNALGGLSLDAATINVGGSTMRSAGLTTIKGAATNTSGGALTFALDQLDLQGTLDLASQALTLTTQNHTNSILLGGADSGTSLGLTAAELSRIANVTTFNVGDTLQTGAISVTSAVDFSASNANTVSLLNRTGGIAIGADLTTKTGATLNVSANAGGATSGAITSSAGSLYGASAMNFGAATGIGASGSPVRIGNTTPTTITAANTASGGIYIQSVGTIDTGVGGFSNVGTGGVDLNITNGGINFMNGGINAAGGNIVINSTGKVDQSTVGNTGMITTGTLTVKTYSDNTAPGTTADINLGNDSAGGNSVAGGVLLETHLASNPSQFSSASITYRSNGGTNLSGFGTTGDVNLTSASFVFTNNEPLIGRNVTVTATAGNITMLADLPNTIINGGNNGGKLELNATGTININAQIGASSAQTIVIGSTTSTAAFNHEFVLNAGGDINVTKSIYVTGDLKFNAGGAVNIQNQGAATKPLIINAANISFGDALNKVASVNIAAQGNANIAGQDRSVLVQAAGAMNIYTNGNFSLLGGTASATGALAAAAIGAQSINVQVGGDFLMQGGTASAGGIASTLVQAGTAKTMVIGNNLVIKGGSVTGSGNAGATLDPSGPMSISTGHNIILQAGTGPNTSALLENMGAINMTVNTAGMQNYNYNGMDYKGLIVIGNAGSGLFNNDPVLGQYAYALADGGSPPPITLTGGIFNKVVDTNLGSSSMVMANVAQPSNPDLAQQIRSTNVGTQVGGLDQKEKKLQDDGCNN